VFVSSSHISPVETSPSPCSTVTEKRLLKHITLVSVDAMNKLNDIESFLSNKRVAIVGVSRNPNDFTRAIYDEFLRRGYDVLPVNPNSPNVDANSCFATVRDITPPPQTALIMISRAQAAQILSECKSAGIRNVWVYGTSGRQTLPDELLAECRTAGMTIIDGECPFMFLPNSGGIHRLHGFVRKVFHSYPA
jgi:predicted CoA-binding protein